MNTLRSFLGDEALQTLVARTQAITEDKDPFEQAEALGLALRDAVVTKHRPLLRWLEQLPLFYRAGNQVFVHAGVDEDAGQWWSHTTTRDIATRHLPTALKVLSLRLHGVPKRQCGRSFSVANHIEKQRKTQIFIRVSPHTTQYEQASPEPARSRKPFRL